MIQGAALYIAAVLGPGILVIPAAAVAAAGPSAVLVLLALTAVAVAIAVTFARLGAALPDTGGITALTLRAFGLRAARISAWVFFFGVPVGVPALVLFGAGYLQSVTGGGRTVTFGIAAALLGICLAINWFGVRTSAQVQILLCAMLAVTVIAIAATVLRGSSTAALDQPVTHGLTGIAAATVLLVWSLTGWEAGTYLAGDFARPRPDIMRATGLSLVVVSATYLLLVIMFALNSPTSSTQAPLLHLLNDHGAGQVASTLVAALAVVATLGGTNAYVASLAGFGAAAAGRHHLPNWLSAPSGNPADRRRPLLTVAAISMIGLLGWWLLHWEATTLAAACAASQIAVYLFGLASARRLLRTGRSAATAALTVMGAVLTLCGAYAAAPVLLAIAAWRTHPGRSQKAPRTMSLRQKVSHSTDLVPCASVDD